MMNNFYNLGPGWYNSLQKPEWTPTPETISLIWTFLYPLIFVTYAYVFSKVIKKKYPKKIAIPFFLNLVFNFSFTPILFGLKNLPLASADIVGVLITVIWSMVAVWKKSTWIAVFQIPYLVWVIIATFLQFYITFNN